MKFCITLLVTLASFTAFAQVKPVYFIGERITGNKSLATSYAIIGKLSGEDVWSFKKYDLNNNLLQTGYYKDKTMSIPHGLFIFYMSVDEFNEEYSTNFKLKEKERFISQKEYFIDGEMSGKLTLYYPDGKILNEQEFVKDTANGNFIVYDKFGRIEIKGSYLDGQRNGEWLFERGNYNVNYEEGVVKSSYKSAKHLKSDALPNDKMLFVQPIVKMSNPTRKHKVFLDVAEFNKMYGTNFKAKEGEEFLAEEGEIVDNLEEGTWKAYFPNGKINVIINFVNGIWNGMFIEHNIMGNEISKGNYINGKRDGEWLLKGNKIKYYDHGKLIIDKDKPIKATIN